MRISDWSSDVCSSDLRRVCSPPRTVPSTRWSPPRCAVGMRREGGVYRAVSGDVESPAGIGRVVLSERGDPRPDERSEEHTSELQSLMRNSYAVFCLKKKNK